MVVPIHTAPGITLRAIGLGTLEGAREFAKSVGLPEDLLYTDEEGICHEALQLSKGFLPDADISTNLKLLGMLAGVGSPGTI